MVKSEFSEGILSTFLILLIVFFIAAIFGYFFASHNPETASQYVERLFEGFRFIDFSNPLEVFIIIFLNNALKSLVSLVTGFFFGIFPLLFIFVNGYLIGMVTFTKGSELGFLRIILALLPHGILEIPAVILASAYGMRLGGMFYRRVFKGEDADIANAVKFFLKKFLRIIVPVLFAAAFVETFITPTIVFYLNGLLPT
ncbi:stage II sporulation protein M [Archaeoglobales archaeon]|nr:MAG: stage II sporulation protein M [Archaeoglobales archaeon]